MFDPNPELRPTIAEIHNHPWMTNHGDESAEVIKQKIQQALNKYFKDD